MYCTVLVQYMYVSYMYAHTQYKTLPYIRGLGLVGGTKYQGLLPRRSQRQRHLVINLFILPNSKTENANLFSEESELRKLPTQQSTSTCVCTSTRLLSYIRGLIRAMDGISRIIFTPGALKTFLQNPIQSLAGRVAKSSQAD